MGPLASATFLYSIQTTRCPITGTRIDRLLRRVIYFYLKYSLFISIPDLTSLIYYNHQNVDKLHHKKLTQQIQFRTRTSVVFLAIFPLLFKCRHFPPAKCPPSLWLSPSPREGSSRFLTPPLWEKCSASQATLYPRGLHMRLCASKGRSVWQSASQ